MAELTFGNYRLSVDVEKTRSYYAAHPLPWITCDCAGCRNFVQAVRGLPRPVKDFFKALGLDPGKPGELCFYSGTPETVSGGGWYHLAGTILAGAGQPGDREAFPAGWYELDRNFSVAFKTTCDLLPEDFPRPCFQMECSHGLPWLLEEKNPYC